MPAAGPVQPGRPPDRRDVAAADGVSPGVRDPVRRRERGLRGAPQQRLTHLQPEARRGRGRREAQAPRPQARRLRHLPAAPRPRPKPHQRRYGTLSAVGFSSLLWHGMAWRGSGGWMHENNNSTSLVCARSRMQGSSSPGGRAAARARSRRRCCATRGRRGRAPTPRATSSGTASTPRTPPTRCSPTRSSCRAYSSSREPQPRNGLPPPFFVLCIRRSTYLAASVVPSCYCVSCACLSVCLSMISRSFVMLWKDLGVL
jgi:hypothetical protein